MDSGSHQSTHRGLAGAGSYWQSKDNSNWEHFKSSNPTAAIHCGLNLFSTVFFRRAGQQLLNPQQTHILLSFPDQEEPEILKSKDDPHLNADSAEQLRTESPAGRRYRQMCHMLCQKGQSQDSNVINTDFNSHYLLSDLES